MNLQNNIPLKDMEELEAQYGVELFLQQTPKTIAFYYKRDTNWFYIGETIMECRMKLERLYKEGNL